MPDFIQLTTDWNADPNVPEPRVALQGSLLRLTFFLNGFAHAAAPGETATLIFTDCALGRLGGPNDEGWYRGQCRYSTMAPAWGEFYELVGPDPLRLAASDWLTPQPTGSGQRHFLFHFRDHLFECLASNWRLLRSEPAVAPAFAP